MIPFLGTLLVASIVEASESHLLDLRPATEKIGWWQKQIDREWLGRVGRLTYSQYLADCYLLAHPLELQRVGKRMLLMTIVEALQKL
jgi:hypothetical protein